MGFVKRAQEVLHARHKQLQLTPKETHWPKLANCALTHILKIPFWAQREEVLEKIGKEMVLSLRGRLRSKEDDFSFVFVFNHPTLFLTGDVFNFLQSSVFISVHETFFFPFHSCPLEERCETAAGRESGIQPRSSHHSIRGGCVSHISQTKFTFFDATSMRLVFFVF